MGVAWVVMVEAAEAEATASKKSFSQSLEAARLKKVLKANHQLYTTGNKTQLMARCVDIELNGALPQCPKCSETLEDGLKPPLLEPATGGGYVCPGFLENVKKDLHRTCLQQTFTADEAQRIPFVDIFDRTPQQSTNKRNAAVSSSAAALKGPSTPKKPRQQPVEDEYGYDDCC